jgi:hypothetical protein
LFRPVAQPSAANLRYEYCNYPPIESLVILTSSHILRLTSSRGRVTGCWKSPSDVVAAKSSTTRFLSRHSRAGGNPVGWKNWTLVFTGAGGVEEFLNRLPVNAFFNSLIGQPPADREHGDDADRAKLPPAVDRRDGVGMWWRGFVLHIFQNGSGCSFCLPCEQDMFCCFQVEFRRCLHPGAHEDLCGGKMENLVSLRVVPTCF